MHGTRLGLRLAAGIALGVAAVLGAATAASAHVRVSGTDTTQGGYGVLTFRVPSESATASTTAITVTLPKSTPILSADTQPMAGWKATVTEAKLASPERTDDGSVDEYVASVTWRATSAAAAIPPGEFQLFNLSVGPLPKRASVAFPTLQRYSDGTTVDWNEASTGSAEPEHPAPVLSLAAATTASTSTPTVSSSDAARPAVVGAGTGLVTGIIGIVLGIVAVVLALIALLRSRNRAPAA